IDKPYLREICQPSLENPIFVQGLPGFSNVGRIAAHLLIKFCGAKPFAELFSATVDKTSLIIMTGETQPSFDDVLAHYQVCDEIVEFVQKQGCRFLVTMGGVPTTEEKTQVYVAATSPRLAAEFMEKGGVIYSKGRIVGGTGLTLALAKERGIEGVCLLGTTTGF